MAIPYKVFTRVYQRMLHGSIYDGNYNVAAAWTTEHLPDAADQYLGLVRGQAWPTPTVDSERFEIICKGYPSDGWVSRVGLDHIMSVRARLKLLPPFENDPSVTTFHIDYGALSSLLSPNVWDPDLVSGRHYNGVDEWDNHPGVWHVLFSHDANNASKYDFAVADLPFETDLWIEAWDEHNAQILAIDQSDYIFRNGLRAMIDYQDPSTADWPVHDALRMQAFIQRVEIKYWNAVVNSLSRYNFPTTGGVECKIYGLGFQNANAEINEGSYDPTRGWGELAGNLVSYIYIEDRAGNVVATLQGWLWGTDYTVDSNSQITIPAAKWPALPEGVYYLRLRKQYTYAPTHNDIDSYAGDFRCKADGRVYDGDRIEIYVGDMTPRRRIFFFSGLGGHYAPIDVRAPETFYEGRILGVSSTSRAIDEDGLCQFGDMSLTLANHDCWFSKLLAANRYKNTTVEVAWGYASEPASWARRVGTFIVADYDTPGEEFNVRLRDLRNLVI